MNQLQSSIFDNLMALTAKNECFYFRDEDFDGSSYRIFNYRIASYSDWLIPSSLECRGIMFELTPEKTAKRLACWPFAKFFNLNENPFTMGLDFTKVKRVWDKVDGSLISTFSHSGNLMFKTKGTMFSPQASDAFKWCTKEAPELHEILMDLASKNVTCNLEWHGPTNRVIIAYPHHGLTFLNARCNVTGKYFDCYDLMYTYPDLFNYKPLEPPYGYDGKTTEQFVEEIPRMTGVEGYVLQFSDDTRVKIKTNWYLTLHKTKSDIDTPRKIFENIINETVDDLKSLFADDPYIQSRIKEVEENAIPKYNSMVKTVEDFFQTNKGLDRKTYAIQATRELKELMGLAMLLYSNRPCDFKAFAIKNWENFLDVSLLRSQDRDSLL